MYKSNLWSYLFMHLTIKTFESTVIKIIEQVFSVIQSTHHKYLGAKHR